MFTMDEDILEAMAQYDQTYEGDEEDEDELLRSCYFERPSTADQAEEGVRHALLIRSVVIVVRCVELPTSVCGQKKLPPERSLMYERYNYFHVCGFLIIWKKAALTIKEIV